VPTPTNPVQVPLKRLMRVARPMTHGHALALEPSGLSAHPIATGAGALPSHWAELMSFGKERRPISVRSCFYVARKRGAPARKAPRTV
jgi:hypothetical protein